MAITKSVIKIYADEYKTQLVGNKTTLSGATEIPISGLTEGTAYWGTVTVEDDNNLTSDESPVYKFYTLPDVVWSTQPVATADTITATMAAVTHDVGAYVFGMRLSTSQDLSNYTDYTGHNTVTITGLTENTTYWVAPLVVDEFGRKWVNESLKQSVGTSYELPIINWYGMSAVGITDFHASVNVISSSPLTSVVCTYTPVGGSAQTQTLSATTGVQGVNLTGLTPNTTYSVVVRATNSAGYDETTTNTFTTNSAAGGIEVALENVSVNNSNNEITGTSKATYDSNVITITGHYLELWDNAQHTGAAIESVSGGANATITQTLSHANPDEVYFLFGRVTYTVSGDLTVYTAWSEPEKVLTYALLSFGLVSPTSTSADVPYSVAGDAISVEIAYSVDQNSWTNLPVPSRTGGTINIPNLNPSTQYYVRGRVQSTFGWSDYETTTFTTSAIGVTVTIINITNIYETGADINLNIQE